MVINTAYDSITKTDSKYKLFFFLFLRLLPYSDVLLKVTIVPRTSLALGFAQYTPSEQKLYSKEEVKFKYITLN